MAIPPVLPGRANREGGRIIDKATQVLFEPGQGRLVNIHHVAGFVVGQPYVAVQTGIELQ